MRDAPSSRRLPLEGIDAAVLVGGLGTRLREVVADVPKPLAPVAGRPFLFYLLDLLALRGARSATLCSGYRADLVRRTVGEEWFGMPVRHSAETEALGTGGALRLAAPHLRSRHVAVLNGDSWLDPDWAALRAAAEAPGVAGALALVEVADSGRFGAVETDAGRVRAFREKAAGAGPGLINGGVYILSQDALAGLPDGPVSLEREVFPALAAGGRLAGAPCSSAFLDIGLPESYASAAAFFERLGCAPHPMFPDAPPAEGVVPKLGACAVILDRAGRVLLERRADCGWWCLPGGRMDAGETLERCAVREAREETGLDIRVTRFLGVFSDPARRTVRYPDNGDLRQLVDAAVVARVAGGELRAGPESGEVRWFAPAGLPLNTVPAVIEMLRCALSGGRRGAVLR